jgi:hypothetical protein
MNFILNHSNAVYLSGSVMAGKFEFKIVDRIRINSVKVFVKGISYCLFKNGKQNVAGREELLLHTFDFITQEMHGKEFYLESGDYSYPFEIQLPEGLPTTFSVPKGAIKYSLNAVLDIPRSFNKIHNQEFNVCSSFTLERVLAENEEMLRTNHYAEKSKVYGLFANSSQPVQARLTLNKNAYQVGENILFQVLVDNMSSKALKKLSVCLVKHTTFRVEKYVSITSDILCQTDKNQLIEPQTQFVWTDGELKVPLTEASLIKSMTKLAEIRYAVKLTVVAAAFFTFDLTVDLPLFVGADPLILAIEGGESKKL